MQARYLLRSELPSLIGPQGIAGGPYNWHGDYDPTHAYVANDAVRSDGRAFFALQSTTGNAPPAYPDTDNAYWALYAECGADGADGVDGATTIWGDVPGTPDRLTDTTFRIIDTGNSNLYDQIIPAGSIISWEKSGGGWQAAKIISATYAKNYVTFEIKGNTLSAGFSSMKYCAYSAIEDSWVFPGRMPSGAVTDIGRYLYWLENRYVFSALVIYGSAPSTTKGVWDINDDGNSIFATKLEIAAGDTEGTETISNSLAGTDVVAVAAKSKITIDYDSGHASTPGSDAYILIWSMRQGWRYQP